MSLRIIITFNIFILARLKGFMSQLIEVIRRYSMIVWAAPALLLVVALVYVVWPRGEVRIEQAALERVSEPGALAGGEVEIYARAVERIAAESRGEMDEVEVVGAPITVSPGLSEGVEKPASAPEGYALVTDGVRMVKGGRLDMEERKPLDESTLKAGEGWLVEGVAEVLAVAEASGRGWAFGWVRLDGYTTLADADTMLAEQGVEVLGSSGRLVRARLPGDAKVLSGLVGLSEVAAVGVVPAERKVAQSLREEMAGHSLQDRVPVFMTLMGEDAAGRWGQALKDLGAEVGRFDPSLRAYSANVTAGVVEAVAEQDFVLSVERQRIVKPLLNSAVAAMGADAVRAYGGDRGLFEGVVGSSVPIGVLDTALNIHHLDIGTRRTSICGVNLTKYHGHIGDLDLWVDVLGHGTHVTGIMAGNGHVDAANAGMAPGVRHIRIGKVGSVVVRGSIDGDVFRGMDFLARSTSCLQGGEMSESAKPLVVNVSLGGSVPPEYLSGVSVAERKIDSVAWGARQVWTVSAGNSAEYYFNNFANGKNILGVGMATDGGWIHGASSHGKLAGGRLKPNLAAVGVSVLSAAGNGERDRYNNFSGTSMSSPAVAGMAALVMDAAPDLQENPALVRARLMASSVRADAWLENPSWFPADNTEGPGEVQWEYGMGLASARLSVLNRDQPDGWVIGHATAEIADGEYSYVDIEVPEGSSRLDLVLTWDEPAAEKIGRVVIDDLDLWLDRDGDCDSGACGEYSSISAIDNVEWVIVRNPEAGVYRAKVAGNLVYTESPQAGLAWKIIRGPSTPTLSMETDPVELEGAGDHRVTVTVRSDGYLAQGVSLHVECRASDGRAACNGLDYTEESGASPAWFRAAAVVREDGMRRSVGAQVLEAGVRVFTLGEVAAGEEQQVEMVFWYDGEDDNARVTLVANGMNARAGRASILLRSGSDAPAAPEPEPPANDTLSLAQVITGSGGREAFDLTYAASEPGDAEVLMDLRDRARPRGSVWFAWEAPGDGNYEFSAEVPSGLEDPSRVYIDAFVADNEQGSASLLSELRRIGLDDDGKVIFAVEDVGGPVYFRLSDYGSPVPALLRWRESDGAAGNNIAGTASRSPGREKGTRQKVTKDREERPANDHFADAVALSGASGRELGSNKGATLERGEWHWSMLGNVWYKWTAPSDGVWSFDVQQVGDPDAVDYHYVVAYTGDDVTSLRMVSDLPGIEKPQDHPARVRAGGGQVYHIMIATQGYWEFAKSTHLNPLFESQPGPYALVWTRLGGPEDPIDGTFQDDNDNDNFANAESLGDGLKGASRDIYVRGEYNYTVEPGEPLETGFVTRWFEWTAPRTGPMTWRTGHPTTHSPYYQIAMFQGDSLGSLVLKGSAPAGNHERREFVMQAEEGRSYRISLGLPLGIGVIHAGYPKHFLETLVWGPPPVNDNFEDATELSGVEGSIVGTLAYATDDPDDRRTTELGFGVQSTWYTYQAEQSGWYRFWVDGARRAMRMSVHRMGADGGLDSLEFVVLEPRFQFSKNNPMNVVFYARAGVRYVIKLGTQKTGVQNFEFEMHWSETEAPVHLKYVGHVPNGGFDAQGSVVSFGEAHDLSFNGSRGDVLYLATDYGGLNVYKRDAWTGDLRLEDSHDFDDWPRQSLVWDTHRTRLLTYCDGWRELVPQDSSHLRLEEGASYPAAGESGTGCLDTVDVMMDPAGSFAYRVHRGGLEVFQIDAETGELQPGSSYEVEGLVAAVMSLGGEHIYAGDGDSILALERDTDTGTLTQVSDTGVELDGIYSLAVSGDGQYLFAAGGSGQTHKVAFFDLSDPASPSIRAERTVNNETTPRGFGYGLCQGGDFRSERYAVEVFCQAGYFIVEYHPEDQAVKLVDAFRYADFSRYRELLPRYGAIQVEGVTSSPDGGHVYVISNAPQPGLYAYERVGNGIIDPPVTPVTRLDLLEVGFDFVQFGPFYASGGDCISFGQVRIQGVSYSVTSSEWQEREDGANAWSSIAGTEVEKELCSYRPAGDGEYRLVTEMVVDSVPGRYASNVLDL